MAVVAAEGVAAEVVVAEEAEAAAEGGAAAVLVGAGGDEPLEWRLFGFSVGQLVERYLSDGLRWFICKIFILLQV